MYPFCLLRMVKFTAVVGLDNVRCIAEIDNRSLNKVYRAVAAVFSVSIDKSLSGSFFNHGILVEFLTVCTHIANIWHIFHVHLPLFAQFCGCIIVSQMLGFLFGGLYLLAISQPDKYTIQRSGMSAIRLLLPQFAIQLANAYVGVAAMIVSYPAQLLIGVSFGVPAMRSVRLWH